MLAKRLITEIEKTLFNDPEWNKKLTYEELESSLKVEWLIEGLFETRTVHILGGPSGSGKTTATTQMIHSLVEGKEIFGFQCSQLDKSTKIGYIACDRDIQTVYQTFKRVGEINLFKHPNVVVESIFGKNVKDVDFSKRDDCIDIYKIIPLDMRNTCKVIIIDGVIALLASGDFNDYNAVHSFMNKLVKFAKIYDITFILTTHATKVKKGEELRNPRERILGSVAWGAFSNTVMIFDPVEPENVEDRRRRVSICPRNSENVSVLLEMSEEGRLVQIDDEETELANANLELELRTRMQQDKGYRKNQLIAEIISICPDLHNRSEATMSRVILGLVESGIVIRCAKGIYKLA